MRYVSQKIDISLKKPDNQTRRSDRYIYMTRESYMLIGTETVPLPKEAKELAATIINHCANPKSGPITLQLTTSEEILIDEVFGINWHSKIARQITALYKSRKHRIKKFEAKVRYPSDLPRQLIVTFTQAE